jgi:hypothetical protein
VELAKFTLVQEIWTLSLPPGKLGCYVTSLCPHKPSSLWLSRSSQPLCPSFPWTESANINQSADIDAPDAASAPHIEEQMTARVLKFLSYQMGSHLEALPSGLTNLGLHNTQPQPQENGESLAA